MFGIGKPKVLDTVKSKYSGTLRVIRGYGYMYVSSGVLTQSGGLINDVWGPVLKKLKNSKNKSWLILGLAAGTAAQIISKKYQPKRIVGVEIDSEMIRIGKQYLGLEKISKLEIVNKDANKYVPDAKFDFVIVDMYLDDKLPEFVYSPVFLKKLKGMGNTVVINHLFYADWMKKRAEELIDKLKRLYSDIKFVRVLTNLIIICESTNDRR